MRAVVEGRTVCRVSTEDSQLKVKGVRKRLSPFLFCWERRSEPEEGGKVGASLGVMGPQHLSLLRSGGEVDDHVSQSWINRR